MNALELFGSMGYLGLEIDIFFLFLLRRNNWPPSESHSIIELLTGSKLNHYYNR